MIKCVSEGFIRHGKGFTKEEEKHSQFRFLFNSQTVLLFLSEKQKLLQPQTLIFLTLVRADSDFNEKEPTKSRYRFPGVRRRSTETDSGRETLQNQELGSANVKKTVVLRVEVLNVLNFKNCQRSK